jgi:hypothetical protein
MNMYLNYYKENELANGDNDPIGIILCSGKNEALVKYATMGLPQQVCFKVFNQFAKCRGITEDY